jgi:hypothetical protein
VIDRVLGLRRDFDRNLAALGFDEAMHARERRLPRNRQLDLRRSTEPIVAVRGQSLPPALSRFGSFRNELKHVDIIANLRKEFERDRGRGTARPFVNLPDREAEAPAEPRAREQGFL